MKSSKDEAALCRMEIEPLFEHIRLVNISSLAKLGYKQMLKIWGSDFPGYLEFEESQRVQENYKTHGHCCHGF